MKDEIIIEAWNAKDTIASRHQHDVRSLALSLQKKEKKSGHPVIDLHARNESDRTIGGTIQR